MKNQSWVVKENKSGSGPGSPRFFIDYNQRRPAANNPGTSFKVLSLLKGDAGMAIKLDSSLFNVPPKQGEGIVNDFTGKLKSEGLEYRYRQFSGPPTNSWVQLFRLRKEEIYHEVITCVPDQVWRQNPSLHSVLVYGTFYYIGNHTDQEAGILESINNHASPEDLGSLFRLIVFDWTYYGQMGLFTNTLSLKELQEMLRV